VNETARIRWEPNGDGNVLLGYVGTLGGIAFRIWGPDDKHDDWLLSDRLTRGGERRFIRADDPATLKADAEFILTEFVSSLGAIFRPEPDESAAFQVREARSVLARWDASRNDPAGKVYDRQRVLADQVKALLPIAEAAVEAAAREKDQ
jgi:hypothetical protein